MHTFTRHNAIMSRRSGGMLFWRCPDINCGKRQWKSGLRWNRFTVIWYQCFDDDRTLLVREKLMFEAKTKSSSVQCHSDSNDIDSILTSSRRQTERGGEGEPDTSRYSHDTICSKASFCHIRHIIITEYHNLMPRHLSQSRSGSLCLCSTVHRSHSHVSVLVHVVCIRYRVSGINNLPRQDALKMNKLHATHILAHARAVGGV